MKVTKLFFILGLLGIASTAFADELYKTNVVASYYADKFNGRRTASGEVFNMYGFTAAHKTLPFGTILKVTNLENGKTVNVRVNDRGPFVQGRELDVSKAAAQQLEMTGTGTARVSIEIVDAMDNVNEDVTSEPAPKTVALPTSNSVNSTPIAEAPVEAEVERWDIQLGAFSDQGNAKVMAHRLVQAGFKNVAYQKVGNITRVVLRDVASEDIEKVATELDKNGFTNYLVRERKNVISND
ncbi:MAG: septal ring lytic transglycosylase RlpA family protein [Treponema sp.]|nr:septal ring lytic transglycosylase RlpA family protein [Treponema sp.]